MKKLRDNELSGFLPQADGPEVWVNMRHVVGTGTTDGTTTTIWEATNEAQEATECPTK